MKEFLYKLSPSEEQRLKRVIDINKNYEYLNDIFKETFQNESTIGEIKYNPIKKSETIFEFKTPFDSNILIKFSLVFIEGKDEFCHGKISFEKFIEGKDNDVFWCLFFDKGKNLRSKLAEKKILGYRLEKGTCDLLIINVLDKYIEKYLRVKNSKIE